MESTSYSKNESEKIESTFSFKNYLKKCLKNWFWFAISFILFIGIAYIYIKTYEPIYERYTNILIEDQDMGNGADVATSFSKMGLVSSNTNVNNELISFTSPAIMAEVVNRLNLTMSYIQRTSPYNKSLYGKTQPFIAELPDVGKESGVHFTIEYNPDGSFFINDIISYENGVKTKFDDEVKSAAGKTQVRTSIGRINITHNPNFIGKPTEPIKVDVFHAGYLSCVETYTSMLKGDLMDKDAEVIKLIINDSNIERADDILHTITAVYNENWVANKNRTAIATSAFIDERLKVIEQELGVVDTDIASQKSQSKIPDLETAAKEAIKQGGQVQSDIIMAQNEYAMTGYIYDYLKDPAHRNSIIPLNAGVANPALEQQIIAFNSLLFERNNLADNSSDNNPLVQEYDVQLKGFRESIMRAIIAQRTALASAIRNLEGAKGVNEGMLTSTPTTAKQLLSSERQQKIKEELYLFLLQKREENELNQAFTAYNTRIITPPTGSLKPVAPKKKIILLIALIFGFGIPASVIYFLVASDTKIHSRKDLDKLSVPFAGEIPIHGKVSTAKKLLRTKKQAKKDIETARIVVKEGNRDVINEAFRVVRSNLNMMFAKDVKCPVVMFTSFNPGSGKSFLSYNLALAFELKKKRVLVIDGDLRHGSASNFVGKPRHGLSEYLLEQTDDWKSLIVKNREPNSPDVLPIGKMPPNPAELLENGRIGKLIEEAREQYDLIILDCPPIDIVVDTQIIEQYADQTIFIVRAGLLERSALDEIQEIYDQKRFKRMSLLLNGTDTNNSRYHTYGNYQNLEADRG